MPPEMVAITGVPPRRSGSANGTVHVALPAGLFRPRPGVLGARALDAMALYDPRTERYLTLNPVAMRVWEGLTVGQAPAAIVNRIAVEYEVPEVQVRVDVAAQLASWLAEGLIEPGAVRAPSVRAAHARAEYGSLAQELADAGTAVVRVPSVLRCGLMIARIKWLLRIRRLEGTLAWVRARVADLPVARTFTLESVRTLEYAIAMAGAFYPGRAKCLEQSLTLYYLARRQGVAVRYYQGVQLYPFKAHAWVEYDGQVINDIAEHVKHLARFPEQLP